MKYLTKGASITIYEYSTTNGQRWGRIGTNQWVCMAYVTVDGSSNSSSTGETGTGTVSCKTSLNVRTGAGTSCRPGSQAGSRNDGRRFGTDQSEREMVGEDLTGLGVYGLHQYEHIQMELMDKLE